MSFPIDLSAYQPLTLDPAVESLSPAAAKQLAANIQLVRDSIVFFTAHAHARGVPPRVAAYRLIAARASALHRRPHRDAAATPHGDVAPRAARALRASLTERRITRTSAPGQDRSSRRRVPSSSAIARCDPAMHLRSVANPLSSPPSPPGHRPPRPTGLPAHHPPMHTTARRRDTIAQDLGPETMVFDPARGEYHLLNPLAAFVFRNANG